MPDVGIVAHVPAMSHNRSGYTEIILRRYVNVSEDALPLNPVWELLPLEAQGCLVATL